MKLFSLIVWVSQFGFSIVFPTCFLLMLANWLQNKYSLGVWIIAVLGILGLLTSFSTAKKCVKTLLKDIGPGSSQEKPPGRE